jgi:hypothetical protein
MPVSRLVLTTRLMGALLAFPVAAAQADCPCRSAATALAVSQVFDPSQVQLGPAYGLPPHPDAGLPPAPMPREQAPPPPPLEAPSNAVPTAEPGTNRFGMRPPPGTLGETYQRRTTLIPDEKHPRIGMVDVHLPEDVDVTARGMKSKWTGRVWQLESESPLLPGTPHIYAIKAEKTLPNGQRQVDVRWVRLIMGRVVDLEF